MAFEWYRSKKGNPVPRVFLLDVLDRATTFDAADGKAGAIGKTANNAGLPFQRALYSLIEFGGFVKINDVNVTVRGGDDQQLVDDIHTIDSFLATHGGYGR